jgi:RNA recognition motif-containing protein
MNIYVGNLPYSVRDDELREAFEPFGTVLSAEVIIDRRSRRSRGYGFVEMESADEGREAIESLDGSDFQGRELRVDESKPRSEKQASRPQGGQRDRGRQSSTKTTTAEAAHSGGVMGFFKRLFN